MASDELKREDVIDILQVLSFSRIDSTYASFRDEANKQSGERFEPLVQRREKIEALLLNNPEFVEAALKVKEKQDQWIASAEKSGIRRAGAKETDDYWSSVANLEKLAKNVLFASGYAAKETINTKNQIKAEAQKANDEKKRLKEIRKAEKERQKEEKRMQKDEAKRRKDAEKTERKNEKKSAKNLNMETNFASKEEPKQTHFENIIQTTPIIEKPKLETKVVTKTEDVVTECKDNKGNTIYITKNKEGVCTKMQLETANGKIYEVTPKSIEGKYPNINGKEKLHTIAFAIGIASKRGNFDCSKNQALFESFGKELPAEQQPKKAKQTSQPILNQMRGGYSNGM